MTICRRYERRSAKPPRTPVERHHMLEISMPAPVIAIIDEYTYLVALLAANGDNHRSTQIRCRRRARYAHHPRGKSFSPRARRQRRDDLRVLDALPIVRRARAAGLHGPALRGYVQAVARLDGPAALAR